MPSEEARWELGGAGFVAVEMAAIEVTVSWGDDVLFSRHLSPARDVVVGDHDGVDFAIARETLGAARLSLVRVVDGAIVVTAARGAHVELASASTSAFRHDLPRRAADLEGFEVLELPFGARVRFQRAGLSFVVAHGEALSQPKGKKPRDRMLAGAALASLAIHLATAHAFSRMPPSSLDEESAPLDRETAAYLLQRTERQAMLSSFGGTPIVPSTVGGSGARHFGEQGMLGSAKQTNAGRYAIKGPPDASAAQWMLTAARINAGEYGVLAVLQQALNQAPPMFDDMTALGRDPESFNGLMRANHDGDALGFAGLGLTGSGLGGGGAFDGLGLGRIGDYGHGTGAGHADGDGSGMGFGGGGGRIGTRRATIIRCRLFTVVESNNHLPPETVRRIVRANHPRLQACYESGLKRDPSLRGSVKVRFVIDATGAVETASVDSGTMTDEGVRACTRSVFESMSFPEPESGKVLVSYPVDYDIE